MVTAILLFISKRKEYVHHVPGQDGSSLLTTFHLTWWLLRTNLWSNPILARTIPFWHPGPLSHYHRRRQHELVPTTDNYDANGLSNHTDDEQGETLDDPILHQQLDDVAQVLHVLPVMAMLPLFWCLYDQQSSVWTLQAKRMELNGLQPEQLNVVNPIEIMLFIPLFNSVIYPAMEARRWNIAPLRRMGAGMAMTAAAFFLSGLVSRPLAGEKISMTERSMYFGSCHKSPFLPLVKYCSVSRDWNLPTRPRRTDSRPFSWPCSWLTTALGDFFGGILFSTVFTHLNRASVMHVCALLMVGNLCLFTWVARWYERNDFRSLRRTPSSEGVEFQEREESS